jgi:uncharacterized protein YeaO (DUF488 family)
MVRIKRIYLSPAEEDGRRILVDRLWPRGVSKEAASVDEWLKELAPSDELRRWFGHDPARWDEFRRRYTEELMEKQELLTSLRRETKKGIVTLLFAARDEEHNNAVVLKEILS